MSTPIKLILLFLAALVLALASRSLYLSLAGPAELTPETTAQIRIAAEPLPAGLLLRDDDLDWRDVALSAVPAGAVVRTPEGGEDITGVMVRRNISAGAVILERDVIRPSSPGFLSAALKPGMRAVSIGVDSITGNAGLIQPGDYVDIILVQQNNARGGSEAALQKARSVVSETIVEKARVIAVGSTFRPSPASDSAAEGAERNANIRTVTIEVMPRAAEAVAVASRLGSLTLALRSFAITDRDVDPTGDAGTVAALQDSLKPDGPLWAGDVSQAISSAAALEQAARRGEAVAEVGGVPPATTESSRNIIIFRGSDQTTQTVAGSGNR